MRDVLVALGHGVALLSLFPVFQSPRVPGGIQMTSTTWGLSGKVHKVGPYCELVWDSFEDEELYQSVLAQFGVLSALQANVTVYIPNGVYSFGRYNAIAYQPQAGQEIDWDNFFLRNVTMLLRDLVEL